MKGWLLDTNVIAEVIGARPDPRVLSWLNGQPEHLLFLSMLTLAEYRKGIENLPLGDQRRVLLQRTVHAVEGRFAGRILSLTDQTVLRWGAMSGMVKRLTRNAPPVVDTLLAATAFENDLYLATRNVNDVKHSGAAVFNPWKDTPSNFPL